MVGFGESPWTFFLFKLVFLLKVLANYFLRISAPYFSLKILQDKRERSSNGQVPCSALYCSLGRLLPHQSLREQTQISVSVLVRESD